MWRILLFLFFITPILSFASNNAGIVRGLWYDQETFFVDDAVRIYVAVRNNTGADLSGTVEFFVNDKKIERKNIDALDGRIVESWADWEPSYGTSTVTATLSRTEVSSTASGTKAIEVVSSLAEDMIFVDYDTDKDGIGNIEDEDDDNDGISDKEEEAAGTDPLIFDEPEPEVEAEESADTDVEEDDTGDTSDPSNREGLEQFLTPSRADTFFGNVTDVVRNTKKKLDDYREERQLRNNPPSVEEIDVNEDGFGEIERISKEERKVEESKRVAEKPEGFFGDLLTFFGNIISGIYTVVLGALSFALGYPALIQVLLLLLILYTMYRIARKIGSRPQQ